jgi:hypothetical protein
MEDKYSQTVLRNMAMLQVAQVLVVFLLWLHDLVVIPQPIIIDRLNIASASRKRHIRCRHSSTG